ncbi:MAG: hypothetical protein ACFB02_08020 [Mastigocoleus sp.]
MNSNKESYQDELFDDELTPEEELEISGYQPEQVALIDKEFLIQQDNEQAEPLPGSENPLIRFGIASMVVGGVMGFGWMIWSIFFAPKPVVKAPEAKPTSTVVKKEESDEAARLKAELALRNQASRNVEKSPETLPPPKPKPIEPVRTVRQPRPSKPRIIRERIPSPPRIIRERVPSPPKIIRERVPAKVTKTPVNSTKREQIDPFERWNKLATLGQQTISPNSRNFNQENPSSEPKVSESESFTSNSPEDSSPPILANASNKRLGKVSDLKTVTIDRNGNREQYPTPGEWGILNRTPPNLRPETTNYANSPIQVQIGTSAKASVLVPVIWSSEDDNQERFAVELQEDVFSIDKRVALSKGTILITQIHSVSKINKLVKQSVVAVVYKDSTGRVKQKAIPKNTILIRGENNRPLLAKSISDKGKAIVQQDILIGLLGAAGRAGEVVNQNQSLSSTVISNNGFSTQTFNSKARKPNILAATVEGFFKPLSQRLTQRANKASSQIMNRPDVSIVPVGTKVSILFNGLFEISP